MMLLPMKRSFLDLCTSFFFLNDFPFCQVKSIFLCELNRAPSGRDLLLRRVQTSLHRRYDATYSVSWCAVARVFRGPGWAKDFSSSPAYCTKRYGIPWRVEGGRPGTRCTRVGLFWGLRVTMPTDEELREWVECISRTASPCG